MNNKNNKKTICLSAEQYALFVIKKKQKEAIARQLAYNKSIKPNVCKSKLNALTIILNTFNKNNQEVECNKKVFYFNSIDELSYLELKHIIKYINFVFKNLKYVKLSFSAQRVLVDWVFTAVERIKHVEFVPTNDNQGSLYMRGSLKTNKKNICCKGIITNSCTCNCKKNYTYDQSCGGAQFCITCEMPDILQAIQANYNQFAGILDK